MLKVIVAKNRQPVSLKSLSLLWPIDSKLGVWVVYVKRQLRNFTQVSLIKVKVTVAKKIQFPLNNLSLHMPNIVFW